MAETQATSDEDRGRQPVAKAMFFGPAAAALLLAKGEPRPQKAIDLAKKMRAEGASERAIYKATNEVLKGSEYAGVSYDAAGQPRFEVSDQKTRLKVTSLSNGDNVLGNVLKRPAETNPYDHRDVIPVRHDPRLPGMAGYTGQDVVLGESAVKSGFLGKTTVLRGEARGALLHEESHVYQDIEGRPTGGTPDTFKGDIKAAYKGKTGTLKGSDDPVVRKNRYKTLAGEQEAELTRARADLSADERRQLHPDDTPYKGRVPRSEQIVVYDHGQSSMKAMAKAEPSAELGHNKSPEQLRLDRAADKLETVARRTIDEAQKEYERPRLMNTARRARMGLGVQEEQQRKIANAKTALKIANALREGEAGILTKIGSLADVERLQNAYRSAMYANKSKREQFRGSMVGVEPDTTDISHAKPTAGVHAHISSSDIDVWRRALAGKKGIAKDLARLESLSQRDNWMHSNPKDIEAIGRVAKALREVQPGDWQKYRWEHRSIGYTANKYLGAVREFEAQKRLGLTDPASLRETLQAYAQARVDRPGADPVKALERNLIGQKIPGFFPTPESLAKRMAEIADIRSGQTVLEPSAGTGRLAAIAKAMGAKVDAVEVVPRLQEILKAKGLDVVASDFTEMATEPKYDRIVMNPPFEKGQDMAHVRKAFEMLKPGGKMVAVMGEGGFFRSDKQATEFRNWLEGVGGQSEKLPEGTFKESNTGVNTRLVTISKPAEVAEQAMKAAGERPGWSDAAREASAEVRASNAGHNQPPVLAGEATWSQFVKYMDETKGKMPRAAWNAIRDQGKARYAERLKAGRADNALDFRDLIASGEDTIAGFDKAKSTAVDAMKSASQEKPKPPVESAVERAMRTSEERQKTLTGDLVKPAEKPKAQRYVTLGDGRKMPLGKYADAWKKAKAMDPSAPVAGTPSDPRGGGTAADVVREMRAGLDDRINQKDPSFGKGRKWDDSWQNDARRLSDTLKRRNEVPAGEAHPVDLRPKIADRLAEGTQLPPKGGTKRPAKTVSLPPKTPPKATPQVAPIQGMAPIGFQNESTLNAALKAQGKAESGKAAFPSDWRANLDKRVKESKSAGNTHLDALDRSVEGMRGVDFVNVHDPKERGRVRTVANTGEVVVDWADEYSANKNLAETTTEGKKQVRRSWLMPTDLKDYVVEPKGSGKIGFQNSSTLNAALKAQGKAEKGKAEVLKASDVNFADIKSRVGKSLAQHEWAVDNGGKVTARVKTTMKGGGEIKTAYLHLTIEKPDGSRVSYRETAKGTFKETGFTPSPTKPATLAKPNVPSLSSANKPSTVKDLRTEAKAAGIKGISRMSKSALLEALGKGLNKAGAVAMIAAPIAAAAVAYDATKAEAKASGVTDTASTAKAGMAAAGAGVATAGIMYGAGKVIGAGLKVASKLAPAAAGPIGIAAMAGLTGYGAYKAFQTHKGEGNGLKAAALSVVGADAFLDLGKGKERNLAAGPTRLNADQSKDLADRMKADKRFSLAVGVNDTNSAEGKRANAPEKVPSESTLKGFQNPNNLKAAMASQGKVWDGSYGKKG